MVLGADVLQWCSVMSWYGGAKAGEKEEEGQGKGNATASDKLAPIDIPGFWFHGIVIACFR